MNYYITGGGLYRDIHSYFVASFVAFMPAGNPRTLECIYSICSALHCMPAGNPRTLGCIYLSYSGAALTAVDLTFGKINVTLGILDGDHDAMLMNIKIGSTRVGHGG